MDFSQKIKKIRKEHGISQEGLANELNVSRQAVSKWENGQGFPETDKLLMISNMFNVSLDYLLKDDEREETKITDRPAYYVSSEMAESYCATKKREGHQTGIGVAVIIFSLSFIMFFERPLGVVLFFLGAAIGISILIMLGFQPKFEGYEEMQERPLVFEPNYLREYKEKYAREQKKYGFMIVTGIVLVILSLVASVLINELTGNDIRYIAVLPLFWGLAVAFIIYAGTIIGAANIIVKNQEHVAELKTENDRGWIFVVVMPLASVIFLGIGFIWDAWHPGWLVFPVASLLCVAYTMWGGEKE